MFAARSLWGAWEKHTASESAAVSRTYSHIQAPFAKSRILCQIDIFLCAARHQSTSTINNPITPANEFGWDARLDSEKLNQRFILKSIRRHLLKSENASSVPRNFAFERKGDRCQSQKLANLPLECGGKRPCCPVKEPSTCSAAAAAAPAAPAAAWKDGCARFSLLSLQRRLTGGRGRGHIWWSGHSLLILSNVWGEKKKIRRTAVFTHFTKPGNYLRHSGCSSRISWDYDVTRAPPSPHFNHWSKLDLCPIR